MKKKILAILVCAAVMLTTACSKSEVNSDPTSGSSKESSSESSNSSETSSEGETSSEPESETPSEPESSTPVEDVKFVHGKMNGNVYTSEFLGIKAEIADIWLISSDEELAEQNGIDNMSDENLNKVLDVKGVAYEMMAMSGKIAVNIVIENLGVTNEEYIDLTITGIKDRYEALGFEGVEAERSTVSFLGSEIPCINIKFSYGGQNFVQKEIPISNGKYVASITFSGANEDEVLTIMNWFKAL